MSRSVPNGALYNLAQMNTFGPIWADNLDPRTYAGDFTEALVVAKDVVPQAYADVIASSVYAVAPKPASDLDQAIQAAL